MSATPTPHRCTPPLEPRCRGELLTVSFPSFHHPKSDPEPLAFSSAYSLTPSRLRLAGIDRCRRLPAPRQPSPVSSVMGRNALGELGRMAEQAWPCCGLSTSAQCPFSFRFYFFWINSKQIQINSEFDWILWILFPTFQIDQITSSYDFQVQILDKLINSSKFIWILL
jgi:hypothetical protein